MPTSGSALSWDLDRARRQCLLLAQSDVFALGDQPFWMDNLYLKVWFPSSPASRSGQHPNLISADPSEATSLQGQRYITRVTLEGDGLGPAAGLWADSDFLVERAAPLPTVAAATLSSRRQ